MGIGVVEEQVLEEPAALPGSRTALHVAARGHQSSLGRKAATPSPWQPSPWRDVHPHHHGNGPELGNGCPTRRNPSPEPAPGVFTWGGDRQKKRQSHGSSSLRTYTPVFPSPPPHLAHNRWKDRRTDTPRHSTCITYCPRWVPLVDGVLKVGPQLIKGYDLGEGCVPVRVGAAAYGPPPVLLWDSNSYMGARPDGETGSGKGRVWPKVT